MPAPLFPNGIDLGNQRGVNFADPTGATDAVNYQTLLNALAGIAARKAVRTVVTGNVSLSSAGASNDGVTYAVNDRVLLTAQTTGTENGVYFVASTGPTVLTRATDMDATSEVLPGTIIVVTEGTVNHDTMWWLTTDAPITLGSTVLTFTQITLGITYTGGAGMVLSGTTFNVQATDTSMTINADDIKVNLRTSSGLQISSGLGVLLDTNPGLVLGAGGLKTLLDTTPGLVLGAGGLKILLDTNPGLVLGAGGIKILLNGSTLTLGASGLSVTNPKLSYAADIGDGSTTAIVVTHSLGTKDVVVEVWDNTTPFARIYPSIAHTSTTTITVTFGTAPTTAQYRVVVLG